MKMQTLYCTYCGHVFGKGESLTSLMFELEEKFKKCPKCSKPLELATVFSDVTPDDIKLLVEMHNQTR